MSEQTGDIVEELLDAADGLSTLSRSAIAELLRRAALDIHELRGELGTRTPAPGKPTRATRAA
jgi:hypothetical protein